MSEWLAGRHPYVGRILREAPPGSKVACGDDELYVVGVGEPFDPDTNLDGWMLQVSPIDPREDYEGSMAARGNVCAAHYLDMQAIAQEQP